MFETGYAIEKLQNFLRTEDDRQFLRLLGRWDDVFEGPVPMECDLIKKAESGYGDEN